MATVVAKLLNIVQPARAYFGLLRQALRSELAQENPDPQKAAAIQKEISGLEAQFDQKRLEHRLEMRKISPNAGGGWMMGGGRGHHGRGMEGCPGGGRGYGARCGQ